MRDFQDDQDNILVKKRGYGRYQKAIMLHRIGVIDKQVLRLPVGSEVIGLTARMGDIYLVLTLGDTANMSERIFYAFNDGQYMSMPNLAGVGHIKIGEMFWFVFEDDMAWLTTEDQRCRSSRPCSPPPAASRAPSPPVKTPYETCVSATIPVADGPRVRMANSRVSR